DLNRVEEAASLNRQMLATNPMNPRALLAEGRILTAGHHYPEAAQALEKAVKASPRSADGFYLLGVAQQSAGFADSARASFARALKIRPQMPEAATALSMLAAKAGDVSQAAELAERAQQVVPNAAAPYLARAKALLTRGEAPQAEVALREALKRDP